MYEDCRVYLNSLDRYMRQLKDFDSSFDAVGHNQGGKEHFIFRNLSRKFSYCEKPFIILFGAFDREFLIITFFVYNSLPYPIVNPISYGRFYQPITQMIWEGGKLIISFIGASATKSFKRSRIFRYGLPKDLFLVKGKKPQQWGRGRTAFD